MLELPTPYLICAVLSGFFWLVTYVLIIRRGHMDKAHGMPLWALSLNFAWEFNYSFITPSPKPQLFINILWCLFDVVILVHFIKSCHLDYPHIKKKQLFPLVALTFAVSYLIVLFCQLDFAPYATADYPLGMGRAYSAFGMNVSMSILFVFFIIRRNNVDGQSLYIAVAKCLGTVFADIPFIMYCGVVPGTPSPDSYFFPLTYAVIFIFDVIYICQVYFKSKEIGLNPLKRI